jgi:hypothetical protein
MNQITKMNQLYETFEHLSAMQFYRKKDTIPAHRVSVIDTERSNKTQFCSQLNTVEGIHTPYYTVQLWHEPVLLDKTQNWTNFYTKYLIRAFTLYYMRYDTGLITEKKIILL